MPPNPLPKPTYTRIDFHQVNLAAITGENRWGWQVAKYIDGWTATTRPHDIQLDPPIKSSDGQQPFDIDKALATLAARGWTVHRWHINGADGARAWRGSPMPVRNREQISRLRHLLTDRLIRAQGHTDASTQVDLALDY